MPQTKISAPPPRLASAGTLASQLTRVGECATLDEVLDLTESCLIASPSPISKDVRTVQLALQKRYSEVKRSSDSRPMRDMIGPSLTVTEVTSHGSGDSALLHLVLDHPRLGSTTVVVRERSMRGLSGLTPGVQVRFSAFPVDGGLAFRVSVRMEASTAGYRE